jgi:hypothetical protein
MIKTFASLVVASAFAIGLGSAASAAIKREWRGKFVARRNRCSYRLEW